MMFLKLNYVAKQDNDRWTNMALFYAMERGPNGGARLCYYDTIVDVKESPEEILQMMGQTTPKR